MIKDSNYYTVFFTLNSPVDILFAATDEFEAAEVNREGITRAEAGSAYYGARGREEKIDYVQYTPPWGKSGNNNSCKWWNKVNI